MLLALGAPWGAATQGGGNIGVLPNSLRATCAVTAALYLGLAAVVGTSWASVRLRSRVLYGTSALMVLGAVVNSASQSFIERIIWTPVTIVLVLTTWSAAKLDSKTISGIDFLRPALLAGGTLVCVGEVDHEGRTSMVASARAVDKDDRVIAMAGATCQVRTA